MKERPIIFSGHQVQTILNGNKTQTRRPVKPQPPGPEFRPLTLADSTAKEDRKRIGACHWARMNGFEIVEDQGIYFRCPYGLPGDRLWVRESFREYDMSGDKMILHCEPWEFGYEYKADAPVDLFMNRYSRWKSSIHMPRHASRITLAIKNIRLERLQDITESDAEAEGFTGEHRADRDMDARDEFSLAWMQIHGFGSWDSNPWVWAIEFRRVEAA